MILRPESKRKICVLVAYGTRPEAIKLAPLIQSLARDPRCTLIQVLTGQHRQMVDQVLRLFRIKPDFDLDLMRDNQDLVSLSHRLLVKLQAILRSAKPDWVVVQGDTTTAFVVAWAAFYERIAVAHVEAGLRSHDPALPFPEEINRRLIAQVAGLHFAPTAAAKKNLLREGIRGNRVLVTGNTGIDSLLYCRRHLLAGQYPELRFLCASKKMILVTCHRRETFGKPLTQICGALKELVRQRNDIQIVYPVHLNPNIRRTVQRCLGHNERIHLLDPLPYDRLVFLMTKAALILTDSGGVQEEAPSLGVPILVMREVTERPEGVRLGLARVVGVCADRIVKGAQEALDHPEKFRRRKAGKNPYGDGRACQRIVSALHRFSEGGAK